MATSTSTQTSKQRPDNENEPLKSFFSQYPKFHYQPRNAPIFEFKRLCKKYQWKQDSAEVKAARDEFDLAMIMEFNSLYGSNEKDINNWHRLCHVLRIDPVPNTLEECTAVSAPLCGPFDFHISSQAFSRKRVNVNLVDLVLGLRDMLRAVSALLRGPFGFHISSQAASRKHVNLVDLAREYRENIPIFKSEKELSVYTKVTKKFFPKESAKDGGILRVLRRHILVPGESRSTQGRHSQPGNSNSHHGGSRAFHSRVPISSRDCQDAPGVLAQPYLTMSYSPHALNVNSPVNAPLSCFTPPTQCTTSPSLVPAAAQRGCTTTVPTTLSSCHVTNHMGGYHPPLSSFIPLKLLANSHDRLYMSYHRLINRIGHMKDIPRLTGVHCPGGVGLSPLFQYSPLLHRASMRLRRLTFLVG